MDELIAELKKRLGDKPFEHEVDPQEWTDDKYCHQN